MQIQYPVFILVGDDKSMHKFDSWSKLENWYEQIDIEADLYSGWDINGYPFKLIWDKSLSSPRIELIGETSEVEQLHKAIKEYARCSRPKVVFEYSEADVINLFKAAEEHVNQGKFWYRISKMFRIE